MSDSGSEGSGFEPQRDHISATKSGAFFVYRARVRSKETEQGAKDLRKKKRDKRK